MHSICSTVLFHYKPKGCLLATSEFIKAYNLMFLLKLGNLLKLKRKKIQAIVRRIIKIFYYTNTIKIPHEANECTHTHEAW